jgi:hypothetical protein
MRLFLYDTLTIRNVTKRIQKLDQKLARAFVSFNGISESIEKDNDQTLDIARAHLSGETAWESPIATAAWYRAFLWNRRADR